MKLLGRSLLTSFTKHEHSIFTLSLIVGGPCVVQDFIRFASLLENACTIFACQVESVEHEDRFDPGILEALEVFVYTILEGEWQSAVSW